MVIWNEIMLGMSVLQNEKFSHFGGYTSSRSKEEQDTVSHVPPKHTYKSDEN
jgi:hypothetical protein